LEESACAKRLVPDKSPATAAKARRVLVWSFILRFSFGTEQGDLPSFLLCFGRLPQTPGSVGMLPFSVSSLYDETELMDAAMYFFGSKEQGTSFLKIE
jgi:hypothetical protein